MIAVDWHEGAVAEALKTISGTIVGMTGNVAEEADSIAMISGL